GVRGEGAHARRARGRHPLLPGAPPEPALEPAPALTAGGGLDPRRRLRVAVLVQQRLRDPRHRSRRPPRRPPRLEGEASRRSFTRRERPDADREEGVPAAPADEADVGAALTGAARVGASRPATNRRLLCRGRPRPTRSHRRIRSRMSNRGRLVASPGAGIEVDPATAPPSDAEKPGPRPRNWRRTGPWFGTPPPSSEPVSR